ncbi:upstream activation factor subunit spp27-like [Diachasma alloeum]|uniref:upstream activation factor subunit spp27-like n=1 Tax=Diachasma alloeum TaxID=454923 RepID=UPI0007384121|nr:upstream activation factor subunit spp27-like [Diachasma alloeum]
MEEEDLDMDYYFEGDEDEESSPEDEKEEEKPAKIMEWGEKVAGKRKRGKRLFTLSPELAAIVGVKQMTRFEVVKKSWDVIKERNLYAPLNMMFAICDGEFMKVIGEERFRVLGISEYLKNHCHRMKQDNDI